MHKSPKAQCTDIDHYLGICTDASWPGACDSLRALGCNKKNRPNPDDVKQRGQPIRNRIDARRIDYNISVLKTDNQAISTCHLQRWTLGHHSFWAVGRSLHAIEFYFPDWSLGYDDGDAYT